MLEAERILRQSNLQQLGPTDAVIFGEVHNLTQLVPDIRWGSQHLEGLFDWYTYRSAQGKSITLLGCREGLWGEAAGSLIRVLQEVSNTQYVFYIGKVGSLVEEFTANEWVATGNESFLGGASLSWNNPLQEAAEFSNMVVQGTHVSVPSPLCETKEWLQQQQRTCSWVDCESWHMAKAASEVGVKFGYLHIVSDNLVDEDNENLSNEDCDDTQNKREILYRAIEKVLRKFVENWGP
ncbi:hypothetical protein CTAM01_14018 [Colletotrichum tamarilloi]|uniref:Nucleoside phosphorylase domain-containing protein n=1 Tax=Colletotrichum tamarilloi TaxID=1209934 RepID=A0ABQ9QQG5_9PEZI|nr:uncharacterized protein CTAM01_14018 [Colletotrichum tamarilloi]KAK1481094.1 hypothetical protein CTAM01_14018 [Colletotrichum tamarilloi]